MDRNLSIPSNLAFEHNQILFTELVALLHDAKLIDALKLADRLDRRASDPHSTISDDLRVAISGTAEDLIVAFSDPVPPEC